MRQHPGLRIGNVAMVIAAAVGLMLLATPSMAAESHDAGSEPLRMAALTLVANDGLPSAAALAESPPEHARAPRVAPESDRKRVLAPQPSAPTVLAEAGTKRAVIPNVAPVPKLIVRQSASPGAAAAPASATAPVEPTPMPAAIADVATPVSAQAAPTGTAAVETADQQVVASARMPQPEPAAPRSTGLALQVASFSVEANARALQRQLATRFAEVVVVRFERNGAWYHRVRVDNFATLEELRSAETALRESGYSPVRTDDQASGN